MEFLSLIGYAGKQRPSEFLSDNSISSYIRIVEGGNAMIKSIALAHRKAGMTRAEYNKYWKEQHAPLAAKLIPGLRKYVQNHFVDVPGVEYEGDGIVEMWYDNVESFKNAMAFIHSDEGKALVIDGDKFLEMKPGGLWVVEEHVIMDDK
jgi:uncharacterized protein (TIGR02118 family)